MPNGNSEMPLGPTPLKTFFSKNLENHFYCFSVLQRGVKDQKMVIVFYLVNMTISLPSLAMAGVGVSSVIDTLSGVFYRL